MNSEAAIKTYRRAYAATEKARDAANAYRGALDDENGRRLRLAVAEAEIALHDAALALDAEDESVAEIDTLARRGAHAFAASHAPANVPPLESYAVDAIERQAAAIAATLPKAATREAAEHTWFSLWSALRNAIELHNAERQARGLPPARWYVLANPHEWRELLGPRPAPPVSSSVKIASDLRRELRPRGDFLGRVRGCAPGDLADARERAAG